MIGKTKRYNKNERKRSVRDYDQNNLIIQEKFESGCVIIICLTFLMSALLPLRLILLLF